MIRQRPETPSFSTNHLPSLDFDAPVASQGEQNLDLEASTNMSEKNLPDYTSMRPKKVLHAHSASLVIPPVPPVPPIPLSTAFSVPTILAASPSRVTVPLGAFPNPPTTLPVVRVPRKSSNKKRGAISVTAEIQALKRKMLQLRIKGSEDSEVFSEAREGVDDR